MPDQKLSARDLLGIAPDAQVAVRAGAEEAIRADERARTLAEVDALIRNDALYLPWSAEYQKLEPESYAFRPWREALAEFVAAHLGGKMPAPTDGEPDVVEDIRRCRETTEEETHG